MSNPVVCHGVVLVCGLTGCQNLSSHFSKQLEHYTFYRLVGAIPKEVPILGAETRVFSGIWTKPQSCVEPHCYYGKPQICVEL